MLTNCYRRARSCEGSQGRINHRGASADFGAHVGEWYGLMSQNDDIVDAEFETLGPSAVPASARTGAASDTAPKHGLGLFGAKSDGRKPMPLPAFAAVATLSACVSFLVAGGHVLFTGSHVRAGAKPAMPPVVLEAVTTRVDTSGGRAVLVVGADLVNKGAMTATVPPVSIRFEREDGTGFVTHVIDRGEQLEAGERMAFTSRIPAGDYVGMTPLIAFAPIR